MDPETKTYQLGIGLAEILGGVIAMSPFQLIQPELDRLSDSSGGMAVLWRKVDTDWVAVARGRMTTAVRVETEMGLHLPLYAGAIGRMVAARQKLSNAKLKTVYQGLVFESPPPWEEYQQQVQKAQASGWALDDSQTYHGVTGVASLIIDANQAPQFGISMVFLTYRRQIEVLQAVGADLKITCQRISEVMYR